MRPEEIRALDPQDLDEQIAELAEELFRLRIQNETGQLENPLRIREVRRDIARCRTIQRETALQEPR